jgi:hypothetical protein
MDGVRNVQKNELDVVANPYGIMRILGLDHLYNIEVNRLVCKRNPILTGSIRPEKRKPLRRKGFLLFACSNPGCLWKTQINCCVHGKSGLTNI